MVSIGTIPDDCFSPKQQSVIDNIDKSDDPLSEINNYIDHLKKIAGTPWDHPSEYMRWLWDYLLIRKAEILILMDGK